jgi:hypothetical protein
VSIKSLSLRTAVDEPGRLGPVTFVDCRLIGFGILPVVEEGDAPPEDHHYSMALEIERSLQRKDGTS